MSAAITNKFRGNTFDCIEVEPEDFVFPFRSASGKVYIVTLRKKRKACSCPAFKWHYKRTGCKHIDFVIEHKEYW